jgi:MFS family permease
MRSRSEQQAGIGFMTFNSRIPIALVRNGIILLLLEFVRGAFLISFYPAYAVDQLGFSLSIVGAIVSVHFLADNMFKCFMGYFLDRFSVRLVVNIGLFVSFAGMFVLMSAHSLWVLLVASALLGIGGSPVWLVCMSQVEEGKRASQMGIIYIFWLTGLGSGPIVINFLIEFNYFASFMLLVVLWALGWVLAWRMDRRQTNQFNLIPFKMQWMLLKRRMKNMRFLIPGMVLQTTAAGMLVPVLSSFATGHMKLSHSEYSFVLIAGGICAALALIPMGKLSDVQGGKWFLVCGCGIFAFALSSLTSVSSFIPALLIAGILGISYAAILPSWNALLAHYVPEDQKGLSWGLFSTIEGIGVVVGPVFGGWIADRYNDSAVFIGSAVIFLIICIVYLIYPIPRFSGIPTTGNE